MSAAACASRPAPPPVTAAAAAPEAEPAPAPGLALENPDFEKGDVAPWSQMSPGYETTLDDAVTHGGKYSLRLRRVADERQFGFSSQRLALPGKPARVVLRGWVKTQDAGGALLFARAENDKGEVAAFANTQARPVTGTTDWQPLELEVVVPPEASSLVLGVMLGGPGQAWFDDLGATLIEVAPPTERTFTGTVVDAEGRPVPGATVALISPMQDSPAAHARSDEAGRFEVRALTGRYGLTATAPGHAAVYRKTADLGADTPAIVLTMGKEGLSLTGKIDAGGRSLPPGLQVLIARVSEDDSDLFLVPVGDGGLFEAV